MSRVRLGTSWRHLAPFVMTMLSLMTPSNAASLDVSGIIDSIRTGSRTVLLLAPLPKSILVIVSSPNSKVLDAEAIVFEESLSSLTDTSMHLTSPQLFTNKWHELPTSADSLAVFRDKESRYLVISSAGNLYFLNLDSKHITKNNLTTYTVSRSGDGQAAQNVSASFSKAHIFISSLQTQTIFSLYTHKGDPEMDNSKMVLSLVQSAFIGSPLPSAMQISQETFKYVCGGDGTVQFSASSCTNIHATYVANWQITAGYITNSGYTLVDAQSLSVFIFPNTADTGQPSYQTIAFEDYWSKGSATLPKKPGTAAPKVHHTTTSFFSQTVIIIIAVVIFILIVIVVSLVALCLYRNKAKPENTEALESEMPPQEPGAPEEANQLVVQTKLTKGKKASKGSHRRRRHSKGAIPPSKVVQSSAESDQQPAHHATMLVYAIDQVEMKNRKASKLSGGGKRRTSKGTPSKRRHSSGRLASPRGRRASALKPASALVQARTSGRVASPRRSALKPPSKLGRRVSAGKPASRRRSRG